MDALAFKSTSTEERATELIEHYQSKYGDSWKDVFDESHSDAEVKLKVINSFISTSEKGGIQETVLLNMRVTLAKANHVFIHARTLIHE